MKVAETARLERRSEPWEAPALRGVTRVRRLVSAEIDAIVADYAAGLGCTLIARKYGIADNTVLVHLRQAGVKLRERGKLTAADVDEMRRLRDKGWTLCALGERYGLTRQTVAVRLRSLG